MTNSLKGKIVHNITNFRFKRVRTIFPCVLFLLLIKLFLYSNMKLSRSINSIWTTMELVEPEEYRCCAVLNGSFRTNVYFLKTHKTGSTTVQNVILRFALLNSLDVLSIDYFTNKQPLSDSSIHADTMTPNNKYHILAQHVRYDSKLKSYQYPNTLMVTILRHPARSFQSAYNYFRMDKWTGMTFRQFLNAPVKPNYLGGADSLYIYHGYNQMSADLGFNLLTQRDNNTAISEFIAQLDRDFDFVMIAEHMEESLVIFADLMGWPLEYVAHVDLNVRPPDTKSFELTAEDEVVLLDLNRVDAVLYYHFLEKFMQHTRQYDQDRLDQQINRLKLLNDRLKERCVAEQIVGGIGNFSEQLKAIEYVPKNRSDLTCVYSIQLYPTLSNVAHDLQADRLRLSTNI